MKIKAAFFDIDGTLVSFQTHKIPPSAHRALEALRQQGVKLFISSGRHVVSMNNLEGESFDGFIAVNGSLCTLGGRTIYKYPIATADVQSWFRYMDTHEVSCCMVTEQQVYMNGLSEEGRRFMELLNFPLPVLRPLQELEGEKIYQFIVLLPPSADAEVAAVLPHCQITRWHPSFTDIVAKGGSKQKGIEAVLRELQLCPEEIIAFGDGANDIEMLRYAGIGVAMGNATERVKSEADYVTTSCDDHGIWNACVHFGLISD